MGLILMQAFNKSSNPSWTCMLFLTLTPHFCVHGEAQPKTSSLGVKHTFF